MLRQRRHAGRFWFSQAIAQLFEALLNARQIKVAANVHGLSGETNGNVRDAP